MHPQIILNVCVKTHWTTARFLFGCRKKALQENTVPVKKNTPVTINEQKEKMKEWLSCWTKFDTMETVIMLLGAGKKKGPLDRERYVHVLHLLPGGVSLDPTSLFTQSLCKMTFTLTLGTDADRPNDRGGVHLLMVHLSVQTVQGYKR